MPRPWSKYTPGSNAYKDNKSLLSNGGATVIEVSTKPNKELSQQQQANDGDSDPTLQEFLQVMKPKSQKKTWANDDVTASANPSASSIPSVQLANTNDEDDLYEDLPSTISTPKKSEQRSISTTISNSENENEEDANLDGEAPELENEDNEEDLEEELSGDQLVAETGRLFVRNLSFSCTEQDLEKHFSRFGPIAEVLQRIFGLQFLISLSFQFKQFVAGLQFFFNVTVAVFFVDVFLLDRLNL